MALAIGILTHTPLWAWAALAYLVWQGMQRMRPRRMRMVRVLITPAFFILWGLTSLYQRANGGDPLLIADWAVALLAGLGLGMRMVNLVALRVDRTHGLVEMPGSPVPLVRNVLLFLAKYSIAVLGAVAPAARPELPWADMAVSGLSAGFFLGWIGRVGPRYRGMDEVDLTQPRATPIGPG